MHTTIKNLLNINENVNTILQNELKTSIAPKIIAVSKTFKIDHIMPLINHGHQDYGENKVQEATEKWSNIKKENNVLLFFNKLSLPCVVSFADTVIVVAVFKNPIFLFF